MSTDKTAHRLRITQHNTRPEVLALVQKHYPRALAERVLACCHRQRAGIRKGCCRDALCPACCPIDSYRIAKAQYAAFKACTPPGRPVRLAHEVYTLPPLLRKRVFHKEGFRAWKDATRAAIREIHGADVAGVMNLHATGDEHLEKAHPHWDVVLNGYLLTPTGRVKEHRAPYIHFDDARAIYLRHLVQAFRPEETPRVVDLWLDRRRGTVFRTSPRRTWHIVRYSARHVYQAQNAWLQEGGPDGRDLWYTPDTRKAPYTFFGQEVIQNQLAQRAWLKGRTRRVWFGYLKDRQRPDAVAAFQRHRAPEPDASSSSADEPEGTRS